MTQEIDAAVDSGLIEADTLFRLMEDGIPNIRLVDATYPADPSLPGIYNAVTFDIDDIADPDSQMAHMLPDADLFASKVGELGISNDDFVVCYDRSGFIMAASRAWWMFRVFGHTRVAVLNGGLENWAASGLPFSHKTQSVPKTSFKAVFNPELVKDFAQVKLISESGSATILDARPPERFVSHIPGSKNMPALGLMQGDRKMIERGDVAEDLKTKLVDLDSQVIASCGSGVTACAVTLALFREGKKDVAVYDGSWTEWSMRA